MATRDIIVIGASAGGVQALSTLVSDLPADLPAAVFIVLHIPSDSPSLLPDILSREARLPVAHARNGEQIVKGRIYVAPPNQHLLVEDAYVKLLHGPKENLHRPSIDVLFRSAARWGGPRVIGVVLTGARDDGATGMRLIKQRGGMAIVQDPAEASFPSMPMSVLQTVKVDYSLPLTAIAPLRNELSKQTVEEGEYSVPDEIEIESRIAEQKMDADELLAASKGLVKSPDLRVRIVMALSGRFTTTTCFAIVVMSGTPFRRRVWVRDKLRCSRWLCAPLSARLKKRWCSPGASLSAHARPITCVRRFCSNVAQESRRTQLSASRAIADLSKS